MSKLEIRQVLKIQDFLKSLKNYKKEFIINSLSTDSLILRSENSQKISDIIASLNNSFETQFKAIEETFLLDKTILVKIEYS